ncbi:polysaccharide lyase [Alphaproteobacteria bacterium]|nr:polysaccharide lyase [Alphaproteobacteria bacterium]
MFLVSSCQTTQSVDGKFIDVQFYSNCYVPKNSITQIKENGKEFRRFILKNGQKGGCPSDRKIRHAAPYWERTELRQSVYLHKGSVYEIKFKVRFVEGFNGSRENFFQIHQYNKGCPRGPLIMLKFSSGTMYGLWTLKISEVLGKWMDFNIILDLINGSYTVKIDDKKFLENAGLRYNFKGCGRPHIKFGIYRPGDDKKPNNTSIADFSKFQIRKVKTENDPYNLKSIPDSLICYRFGTENGKYIKEAEKRNLNCKTN